jgi:adenylosuccinate lyase
VYPKVIEKHLRAELPFMATENILMAAVEKGGDRQVLHEKIRRHSQAAGEVVKQEGGENDLLERLGEDPDFAGVDIEAQLDPARFVGRAPEQVDAFLENLVEPIRRQYPEGCGGEVDLEV